jgi:hypothetical protein
MSAIVVRSRESWDVPAGFRHPAATASGNRSTATTVRFSHDGLPTRVVVCNPVNPDADCGDGRSLRAGVRIICRTVELRATDLQSALVFG